MEQNITPERVANAIMQDNTFDGFYLILEGNKDTKVFQKFTNKSVLRIKEAFGNENVKEILRLLNERGFKKKIGVIDSDFNQILAIDASEEDLFVTDDHDIEVMIIKTKTLETVINHFCAEYRIKAFEKSKAVSIREILFKIGSEISFLKLANKLFALGLVFKPERVDGNQLKYKRFIDEDEITFLGKQKMIETVINFSTNRGTKISDRNEISDKFDEVRKNNYDLNHLVNGHDLTHILFLLMKKALRSNNKMLIDYNAVEDSLILAYEFADFQKTKLFENLSKWADENKCELFIKS